MVISDTTRLNAAMPSAVVPAAPGDGHYAGCSDEGVGAGSEPALPNLPLRQTGDAGRNTLCLDERCPIIARCARILCITA